ncbi:Protein YIPF6 [Wickerhamiella sorbophila]|uniref:Protein YIP n=1 Tax=Wickerhamiella sorbophila TaxID=45607 RepID=A0A2T0FPD9_9ASCO|nr:Protein YIPF6 [Wickerhamiella sorbophila]PRT56856.1 Protein YIPF6 [Wickerhamiella sorbophila]
MQARAPCADMSNFEPDDFEIEEDFIEPDSGFAQPSHAASTSMPEPAQVRQVANERTEPNRYKGSDTLDETVTATIMRDVYGFGRTLREIMHPSGHASNTDWDLWGPLVFGLGISLVLGFDAGSRRSEIFTLVFSGIWLGQAVVALNGRLLGGSTAFLRGLCVTGYCLFPFLILTIIDLFLLKNHAWRIIPAGACSGLAFISATRALECANVKPTRKALVVYPVVLFYTYVGWMCVVF